MNHKSKINNIFSLTDEIWNSMFHWGIHPRDFSKELEKWEEERKKRYYHIEETGPTPRRISDGQMPSSFNEQKHTFKMDEFPPTDIIRLDNGRVIQIALAGFDKKDVEIKLTGDVLVIKGCQAEKREQSAYIQKSISSKSFTKSYKLIKGSIVQEATLENGILTILIKEPDQETVKETVIAIK